MELKDLIYVGVGTDTDFAFDNLISTSGAGSEVDILQTTFQYDALGRRIAKSEYVNGVHDHTTCFYYDGNRVIEERDGNTGTVEATYLYGNYVDEVLQMRRDTNADTIPEDYYYHTDDLFNVVAITDSDGVGDIVRERYDYADYGMPDALSAIGNPFYFNGQRYDQDLGLYHYRARYMDPNTGRFVQRDPIGLWGDGGSLGNGYAYAGNNPWSRMDPYGLNPFTGLISEPFNYFFGSGPDPYGAINPEKLERYFKPKASTSGDVLGGDFGRKLPRGGNSAYAPEVGNQLGTAFEETLGEAKDWGTAAGSFAPVVGPVIAGAEVAEDVSKGDFLQAGVGAGILLITHKKGGASADVSEQAIHRHHPLPRFLGGKSDQVLSALPERIHVEFHSLLRRNLKDAGIPLNVGGRGGSALDWAKYGDNRTVANSHERRKR